MCTWTCFGSSYKSFHEAAWLDNQFCFNNSYLKKSTITVAYKSSQSMLWVKAFCVYQSWVSKWFPVRAFSQICLLAKHLTIPKPLKVYQIFVNVVFGLICKIHSLSLNKLSHDILFWVCIFNLLLAYEGYSFELFKYFGQ